MVKLPAVLMTACAVAETVPAEVKFPATVVVAVGIVLTPDPLNIRCP